MAKRVRRTRQPRKTKAKQSNWLLIIGGTIIGAAILFALLYLALREPEVQTVAEYCDQHDSACVTVGSDSAPVTIVEVSDYGCGHCRDFNLTTGPILEETYVAEGEVKWVVLPYALRDQTMPAAEAAMCANEQGLFLPYHRALFALQETSLAFTREGYLSAAETAGIGDLESFQSCLNDGDYRTIINANRAIARQNGVSGTPTFFINDQSLEGNQPLETFQRRIATYLDAGS